MYQLGRASSAWLLAEDDWTCGCIADTIGSGNSPETAVLKARPNYTKDIVIIDETETCPYLPQETARMPLCMPIGKISLADADERLAHGYRRTGEFVYRTKCPTCRACQALRVDCSNYKFSKNEKRILSRNSNLLEWRTGPLVADEQRVELFNLHRLARGLAKVDKEIDLEEYIWGFVRSCFDSFEITYWLAGRLVCLAVCDRGQTSISAVYTFFDPELARESLGTYSILNQIKYCQEMQLQHLYLGYYVEECRHMVYKQRFLPQERLIDNRWVRFE